VEPEGSGRGKNLEEERGGQGATRKKVGTKEVTGTLNKIETSAILQVLTRQPRKKGGEMGTRTPPHLRFTRILESYRLCGGCVSNGGKRGHPGWETEIKESEGRYLSQQQGKRGLLLRGRTYSRKGEKRGLPIIAKKKKSKLGTRIITIRACCGRFREEIGGCGGSGGEALCSSREGVGKSGGRRRNWKNRGGAQLRGGEDEGVQG